jgi:hypothetical protein
LNGEERVVPKPEISKKSNSQMQIAVTLILLIASLFVILSAQYDANSKHWAFATVGTILGFWLKAGR